MKNQHSKSQHSNTQHSNHNKEKQQTKQTVETAAKAAESGTRNATAMLEQGAKNIETAVRTGMQFQQDTAKWWMNLFMPSTNNDVARQPMEAARQTMIQGQKNIGLMFNLMEQNSRAGTELLQKTVEAMQSKTLPEAQTRVFGIWESAFGAAIETTRAITEANSRAIQSWVSLMQGRTEPQGNKA